MATPVSKAAVCPVSIILLAAAVAGVQPAHAQTWQKTAAGTYNWNDNANWNSAFPNAVGAAANLGIDSAGNQTVNLNQAITIGSLTAGDTNGSSGLTIASGTGGNPLVFQGAAAGALTTVNVNTAAASGTSSNVTFNSGITLGGTSPLTFNLNGTASASYTATISTLNLNGNTFTVTGVSNSGIVPPTALLNVNGLTGGGAIVQNGGYLAVQADTPSFTGSITVNNGSFGLDQYKMAAVSQYAVGGAFEIVNGATGAGKYPIGGWMKIGDGGWPALTTLPDRLNHNGAIVFNGGGYLQYSGQALSSSLSGQAVVEQVKQIKFNPGMSEMRVLNGNGVSSSTTLLANDPTNACVRAQGATFMVGGDDNASNGGTYWLAMGVVEKLKFASGMSKYMIGGGGAAGSQNVSVIPWMTGGTIYHPMAAKMMTYDTTNGVRCLTASEYYTGAVYGAPAYANVSSSDLNLGTGHTQTINAYAETAWDNVNNIGAGSTLTVTSGLVQFHGSGGSIGNDSNLANAGTLNFGSAEGIIWTAWQAYNPNTVGSTITGSGGLTTAGTNVLVLKAHNTYAGKTTVGAGILQVGDGILAASSLGAGDVEVTTGATLRIKANVANAITDTCTVTLDNAGNLFFGKLEMESGINETVQALILDGVPQPAGTYGSSASSATYTNDNYFAGTGMLTVSVPEPSGLGLLAIAGLALGRRVYRP